MDILTMIVIVAAASLLAPASLAAFMHTVARKRWRGTITRQELVAERRADAAIAAISGKLEAIHALVDSNVTAAIQDGLDARSVQLVTMAEILDLKRADGRTPTPEALQAVQSTQAKIIELERLLGERRGQSGAPAAIESRASSNHALPYRAPVKSVPEASA